ncbi:hypothetical protein BC830DRAFT_1156884 [Chytriomyces sp. MP71]|nr:hypothetical protein BC830DRAFT_1156884 [Chytriomyces sp. MP71]
MLFRQFAAQTAPLRAVRGHSTTRPARRAHIGKVAGVAGLTAALCVCLVASDTRFSGHAHAAMPLLHRLDAEQAHVFSVWLAKVGAVPREGRDPDAETALLKTQVLGLALTNPVGLAAGYDKHAEAVDALLGLGFGAVEIGSVTPVPQQGNPKPRVFRLSEDAAVINRYGFNSDGHSAVGHRLANRVRKWLHSHVASAHSDGRSLPEGVPHSLVQGKALGVNLGKNKASAADDNSDYTKGVERLGQYADYIVVNISSPNTPGLRSLQRREPMLKLLQEVKEARDIHVDHRPPLFVKIAPDVTRDELEDIAAVVAQSGIDGVIISNTTLSRPEHLKSLHKGEMGGLSGPPVFPLALEKVRQFYQLTHGAIPIIGCGGISNAEEALAFAKAGASLIQLYTALGYKGPGIVYEIKRDLVELLKKEGKTWREVVGADHR